MITVNGIRKSFGKVRAVRGVSFTAPDGKITGLLGPNGAGKSTTLRILYTVLKPDEGTAIIDGADVVNDRLEARTKIGALPHGAGLYPHLSARENIAYYARLCGLESSEVDDRVDAIVRLLEIEEFADRRTKRLFARAAYQGVPCASAGSRPAECDPRRADERTGCHGDPIVTPTHFETEGSGSLRALFLACHAGGRSTLR